MLLRRVSHRQPSAGTSVIFPSRLRQQSPGAAGLCKLHSQIRSGLVFLTFIPQLK